MSDVVARLAPESVWGFFSTLSTIPRPSKHEEKVVACHLAREAKADYVKTSTGFLAGGATVFDVALMRETVGPDMGVKASGGVRTAADVEDMIEDRDLRDEHRESLSHRPLDRRAQVFDVPQS